MNHHAGAGPALPISGARRLLLVRHGQTDWNLEGRVQGQTDVPLNAVGLAQADEVAPLLASQAPQIVVSSDLARARETALRIAAAAGVEARVDARLREFDLGERSGTLLSDFAATHADEFAAYRSGRYDVVPGAETREELLARFVPAVRETLAALDEGRTGVLVAHGAALKVALVALMGWPEQAVTTLHALANCHWVEVDDSAEEGALSQGLRLVAYNVQR